MDIDKQLLFLHINGEPYIEMWNMLYQTIIKDKNRPKNIEILIISTKDWIEKIKQGDEKVESDGIPIPIHYNTTVYNSYLGGYSGKLDIIDWDNINDYNKIIYVDTDILFLTGGLEEAFNLIDKKDIVYGCRETFHFTRPWFYHKDVYSEEETKKISCGKNTNGINTGVWGWINYPNCKVQQQLKEIRDYIYVKSKLIKTDAAEQPYINHRWLVDGNFEYKMTDVVTLFPEHDIGKKILHFIGENKINRMKKMFDKYM
jgi:hypothetical protein